MSSNKHAESAERNPKCPCKYGCAKCDKKSPKEAALAKLEAKKRRNKQSRERAALSSKFTPDERAAHRNQVLKQTGEKMDAARRAGLATVADEGPSDSVVNGQELCDDEPDLAVVDHVVRSVSTRTIPVCSRQSPPPRPTSGGDLADSQEPELVAPRQGQLGEGLPPTAHSTDEPAAAGETRL